MNSKKPKLSFVVPVFNKSAYLSECLESLINQTEKNIEIIIVDDCSTDSSRELINYYYEKYPDKIVVVYLDKNMGRSYARNHGNKLAKADIIAVQDADDMSVTERASIILKTMDKKKLDVFYSSFFSVDMFGKTHKCVLAIPFDFERVKSNKITYIGHSTMAYRKKAVLDVKYSDGKWSKLGLDDFKLQMDLYRKGYKFGFNEKPTIFYRNLSDTISATRDYSKAYKVKEDYLETIKN